MSLVYDSPLADPSNDLLGRAPFAQALAEAILSMEAEEGFVFALQGPWGSGKTSTLNFVLHYLNQAPDGKRPVAVHFNPWWFSGRDQLIRQFFNSLRQSLGGRKSHSERMTKIGEELDKYSRVLTPLTILPGVAQPAAGIREFLKTAGESAKAMSESLQTDAYSLRQDIDRRLREQDQNILVLVDDLDRLPAEEIRLVFQLVKAVADFPRTIYLLAYDHSLVVRALETQQAGGGQEYLEKIVQAPFDMPPPDPTLLSRFLFGQLDESLKDTPPDLFDPVAWGNLYHDGIARFIRNPRDVKRLGNALRVSYPAVRREVAAHEFIAVQAIRTFAPSLYNVIAARKDLLAGSVPNATRYREDPKDVWRAQFESMISELPSGTREPASSLMSRLFPRWDHAFGRSAYGHEWEAEWRRKGRVCSPDVYDLFFRLALPEGGLGRAKYMDLIGLAKKPAALAAEVRSMAKRTVSDGRTVARIFLDGFQDFVGHDVPDLSIPGVLQALFEVGDDLIAAGDSPGMFEFGNDMHLLRIIHQLLRRVTTEERRLELLQAAIASGESVELPTREVSIRYQGLDEQDRAGAGGDELLSRERVDALRSLVVEKIRSAAVEGKLLELRGLSYVLYRWKEWTGEEPETFVRIAIADDASFAKIARGFSGHRQSVSMGDLVARRERQLDLDGLRQVTGMSDVELSARAAEVLAQLADSVSEDERECLELLEATTRERAAD